MELNVKLTLIIISRDCFTWCQCCLDLAVFVFTFSRSICVKKTPPLQSVWETQSTSETPGTINRFNMLFLLFSHITNCWISVYHLDTTPFHLQSLWNITECCKISVFSIYCYLCRSGSELNSTPDVFYSQSQTSAAEIKFKQSSFFSEYEMINITCLISAELGSVRKFKYKLILI